MNQMERSLPDSAFAIVSRVTRFVGEKIAQDVAQPN
jgi:hypothetical protein